MKKLVSLLLILAMVVSLGAVCAIATEDETPTIIRAVAINHTQFKITTSEPVTVKNNGCFALFVEKSGVIPNLTERDGRFGGSISPANMATTEFIWTINENGHATNTINAALAAGHKVYFGLNGAASNGMIDIARAVDGQDKGFAPNLALNHDSHRVYGVEVQPYTPNTVVSAKAIDDTYIVIEFANPIVSFTGAVLFGVLDASGKEIYNDDGTLDDYAAMQYEIVDGKLVCHLETDKAGMPTADARNVTKIVEAIEAAYPGHRAGIGLLEANVENLKNTGVLEQVLDADNIPLKGTSVRSGRDLSAVAISVGVAKIGQTAFFTLDEALASAKAGDEIVMLEDAVLTDKVFVLDAGVTLNLNGNTLAVNSVLSFGDIVDATEGEGKLVPAASARVILNPENSTLPLFDTDGYRFFTYTLRSAGMKDADGDASTVNDSVRFGVQLFFENEQAYALLVADEQAAIAMALTVVKTDKTAEIAYTFNRNTLEKYRDAWSNRVDMTKTPTIVLNVGGTAEVTAVLCTPALVHGATTVSHMGETMIYPQVTAE